MADCGLIEAADLDHVCSLISNTHLCETWCHCGDREIAQSERVFVIYPQTVGVDVAMSHAVLIEELEKKKTFVVEVNVFLLREDFLTAVAFLIPELVVVTCSSWSIKHVDQRHRGIIYERNIVQNGVSALINDKYFLVYVREELFGSIGPVIFQELHQLSLIYDVEEGNLIYLLNLLGHLDDHFIFGASDLIECA